MVEEKLVGRAEIIKASFTVRCADEAMFGALSIAGEAHIAFKAVPGQCVPLGVAEVFLLLDIGERSQRVVEDVAQLVFWINVVVAGIEIALVLDGQRGAAGFREDAKAGLHPEPGSQRDVEDLDESNPDVIAHPFIEDGAKKLAICK